MTYLFSVLTTFSIDVTASNSLTSVVDETVDWRASFRLTTVDCELTSDRFDVKVGDDDSAEVFNDAAARFEPLPDP